MEGKCISITVGFTEECIKFFNQLDKNPIFINYATDELLIGQNKELFAGHNIIRVHKMSNEIYSKISSLLEDLVSEADIARCDDPINFLTFADITKENPRFFIGGDIIFTNERTDEVFEAFRYWLTNDLIGEINEEYNIIGFNGRIFDVYFGFQVMK